MIKKIIALCALLVSSTAFAVTYVPQQRVYKYNNQNYQSVGEVCSAWFSSQPPGNQTFYESVYPIGGSTPPYTGECRTTKNNGFYPVSPTWLPCPPEALGTDSVAHVCLMPDPPPCAVGEPYKITLQEPRPSRFPTKVGTCQIKVIEVIGCRTPTTGPNAYKINICTYLVQKTGGEDTSNPVPETPMPPPSESKQSPIAPSPADESGTCPAGTVQGGIDSSGITICMGSGTAPAAPKTAPTTVNKPPVSVSNPDGSVTTTQQVVTTNSDGSTTTTNNITVLHPNGTSTTSQTRDVSNTPTGNAGRSDSTETDKESLCAQMPDLNICKNSSVNGSCEAVSCVGDAIQCATLREVAIQQCRDKAREDAMLESGAHAVGQAALSGTPDPSLPSKDNASIFDVGDLNQNSFLSGSACFPDKTITVRGYAIVLPFSSACGSLLAFRYVVMVIASLVAFRILSGSFLKD